MLGMDMKRGTLWGYSAIVIVFLYILYYFRESDHIAGTIAFGASILFFYLGDKLFKIGFKKYHYGILIFMTFFGLLLSPLYVVYPLYDKVLHFTFPLFACFLIFYIVDKLKLDLGTKLIFTFAIMITFITFEEIVEFLLDWLFDLKLQGVFEGKLVGTFQMAGGEFNLLQSRITDTMIDLMLGVLGSSTFVISKWISDK